MAGALAPAIFFRMTSSEIAKEALNFLIPARPKRSVWPLGKTALPFM